MIRTASHRLASCHRARSFHLSSPSLLNSCTRALASDDRRDHYARNNSHAPISNNNNNAPTIRCMSSNSLPGFGSKPIAPELEPIDAAETAISSVLRAADTNAVAAAVPFEPTSWPSDQVLVLLNYVHETALYDHPYAVTIGAVTLAFRVLMFPVFAAGQRNASRMAHMQPELKQMKESLDAMGPRVDMQSQQRYMNQTRALFKRYDCNPLMGLVAPLLSAPFFISMFLGLKNAPDHFPEIWSDGGLLWFADLTQPDPYMALPLLSAATFLGMTEVGKEQMMASDPARGRVMVNVFRAMAVAMVPFTMNFNAGVFVYWTVNNTWSFGQAMLFKNDGVKRALGIWDPPKPVPGQGAGSIIDEVQKMMNKKTEETNALAAERVKAHNDMVSILFT